MRRFHDDDDNDDDDDDAELTASSASPAGIMIIMSTHNLHLKSALTGLMMA